MSMSHIPPSDAEAFPPACVRSDLGPAPGDCATCLERNLECMHCMLLLPMFERLLQMSRSCQEVRKLLLVLLRQGSKICLRHGRSHLGDRVQTHQSRVSSVEKWNAEKLRMREDKKKGKTPSTSQSTRRLALCCQRVLRLRHRRTRASKAILKSYVRLQT